MTKNKNTFKYGVDSNYRNISDPCYDEEYAVRKLHDNLDEALGYMNDYFDNYGTDTQDNITITVNGVAHEFILGGPQAQGICDFMRNICNENGYELPWEDTVKQQLSMSKDELAIEILKDMKEDAHQPWSNIIMWAMSGLETSMDKAKGTAYYQVWRKDEDERFHKAIKTALTELEKINR